MGPWFGIWFFGFLLAILTLGSLIVLIAAGSVSTRRWEWAGVVAAPLALGAWIWAENRDVPLRLRIAVSHEEIMRFVESESRGDGQMNSSTEVGMFKVHSFREFEGCFFLTTKQGWFFSTAGLARCEDGGRPKHMESGMALYHVSGPWWEWEAND